jgi:hypothetical protein
VKRFVVGTSRTTVEQDNKFLQLVRARWPQIGWWHQVSETWLFADLQHAVTAAELRDLAMQAFPTINVIVIEITGNTTWAAFGPSNTMFPWLKENWGR